MDNSDTLEARLASPASYGQDFYDLHIEALDEIVRLREVNAELLDALDDLQACSASIIEGRLGAKNSLLTDYNRARTAALDAIAKARGVK